MTSQYFYCSKCKYLFDQAGPHQYKHHKKHLLRYIPHPLIQDQEFGLDAMETVEDLLSIVSRLLHHINGSTVLNLDGDDNTEDEEGDAYPPDVAEWFPNDDPPPQSSPQRIRGFVFEEDSVPVKETDNEIPDKHD
jgi:hypothetical protein